MTDDDRAWPVAQLGDGSDDQPLLGAGDHVSVDGRDGQFVVMRACAVSADDYEFEDGRRLTGAIDCGADKDVYQVVDPTVSDLDLADLEREPLPRSLLTLEHAVDERNRGDD